MKALDPITGPLSRDEFKALIAAPCGEALRKIRKIDPLYGRKEGEKITWSVTAERDIEGYAEVKAASLEEAKKLAGKLEISDFDWDVSSWSSPVFSINDVEPLP